MTRDFKKAKRVIVFVAGITVLLLGIVMLVAPGPGILTIALGLGILAAEFAWARRLLKSFREKGTGIANRLFGKDAAISSMVRGQAGRGQRRYRTFAVRARLGSMPISYPPRHQ